MKTLQVVFTDKEYEKLLRKKTKFIGAINWHQFIILATNNLIKSKEVINNGNNNRKD